MRVLLAEDDPMLGDGLCAGLRQQGFQVDWVRDGEAAERELVSGVYAAGVLDLGLPRKDGLDVLQALRARRVSTPVLVLTARDALSARVAGLDTGADDYMLKPFDLDELLARIRAVLRRHEEAQGKGVAETQGEMFRFGGFQLDVNSRSLSRDGAEIALTAGEFNLLRIFVEHPNRVLNRDQLMELMKGYERSPFDRSIDVRVTRLRRKIETDPTAPEYVRTVWGEGYLFTPEGKVV